MAFPDKLKRLREKHGLTQVDLAKKLEITQRAISYYETGKGNPNMEIIGKLTKIFNVSVDYLLLDDEDSISKIKAVIDKLRADTRNNLLSWEPSDKAIIYTETEKSNDIFDNIQTLFSRKEFEKYGYIYIDYKQSYFSDYKKGGYLLGLMGTPKNNISIALFVYYKTIFRFIAESGTMPQIEDLYYEVKEKCSGIDDFIDEYLRDSSLNET